MRNPRGSRDVATRGKHAERRRGWGGACDPRGRRFRDHWRLNEDRNEPLDERGTLQSIVDFMLEQRGMTRADLAPLMGGRARVSEFFAGKRRLSIPQIQRLREVLGIPADLLIV